MSVLVCDVHKSTATGKLFGFYITIIQDGTKYRKRLRLCGDCIETLCAKYGQYWSDGFILNRFTAISKCSSCQTERGERGTLHPMYVTAYSAKGTRYDYYATYCDECASTLRDTFELEVDDRHAA